MAGFPLSANMYVRKLEIVIHQHTVRYDPYHLGLPLVPYNRTPVYKTLTLATTNGESEKETNPLSMK